MLNLEQLAANRISYTGDGVRHRGEDTSISHLRHRGPVFMVHVPQAADLILEKSVSGITHCRL